MPDEAKDKDSHENAPRLLISAPVILRALASYLEVTGEAEKFGQHLIAVMKEAGIDADVFDGSDYDQGGEVKDMG